MPSIKIISLPQFFRSEPRGWSFTPFKDPDLTEKVNIDLTTFHTVSLEPGTIRGNHFHRQVTEWLLFCGGPILLLWQDTDSEEVRKILITNNQTLVVIPPGVKHAVKNMGDQPLYLIAFRSPSLSTDEPEALPALLIE